MNSGIYCIENMINGKKYIGYASNITNRWKQHKSELRGNYHDNRYLLNAWNKYGEENFKFWVIEEYPKEEEKLKLMEIYFIAYYNTFFQEGEGYNLSRGGEACFGHRHSEESKKKMSEAMSGKKFKKSSSCYFGVSFNKLSKKWIVSIFLNKKSKYIGRYKEEIDAAKAYDKYIIENNLLKPLNFKKEEK